MKDGVVIIFLITLMLGVLWLFNYAAAANEDFSVSITPENPGPNTGVSVRATSYIFDINRATIIWSVNDVIKLKGVGARDFSFKTGNIGSRTDLSVSITTEEGSYLRKDFSFRPAEVDILWEAQTYAPINYKGKSLPSSESLIKITAVPHFYTSEGKMISAKELYYEWEIDYKKSAQLSGKGKNYFFLSGAELFNANRVAVTVSSFSKSIIAKNAIDIKIKEPKIIFYKEDPLEGPKYNAALQKEFQMIEQDTIIRAEPYFFSKKDLEKLSYKWMLNGKESEPEEFVNMLSLRAGEEPGRSSLGLRITNPASILQFAENALNIIWGQ